MSVVATGLMQVGEVRGRLAGVLAPASDTDPDVLVDVVDAVSPPAVMLLWDDPWLSADTFRSVAHRGKWTARLEVLLIASRVEPGPGIETLEALVTYVIDRITADDYAWPVTTVQAPRVFTIGGVPYLGARITLNPLPVTV